MVCDNMHITSNAYMYVLILTCWILNLLKNGINWKRNAGKQIPKYAICNELNNALHFVLLVFTEVNNKEYMWY